MKIFLTFLALFIVNVNMIVFHDDMRVYNGIKGNIENVAENCAHGASTYFDLERYSEGILEYDRNQAVRLMDDVRARCLESDKKGNIKELHIAAYFFDESGICHVVEDGSEKAEFKFEFPYTCQSSIYGNVDGDGDEIIINEPSVGIFVRAEIIDPFRQPFIAADSVTKYCIYGNQANA